MYGVAIYAIKVHAVQFIPPSPITLYTYTLAHAHPTLSVPARRLSYLPTTPLTYYYISHHHVLMITTAESTLGL